MKNVLVVLLAAIGAACSLQKNVETRPVGGSVVLATFTAEVDPAAGTFVVHTTPVSSGAPGALHASVIVGEGGGADTVTVSNDVTRNTAESLPASVAGGCGPGVNAYKGYVQVTSNYTTKVLRNVYLVIDSVTPGREACTSVAPMGSGLSNAKGLYYYWDIHPGQTVSVPWSFNFSSATAFTFSGHVEATPLAGGVLSSNPTADASQAIKTDGTLWSWGANAGGQLGLGTIGIGTTRNVPTQVGAGANWASTSAAYLDTRGVKTDGTLWSWGDNTYGQLGLGDSGDGTNRLVPTRVGTGTNWASVSAGSMDTLALKTDGTLWSWGDNDRGELGLGDNAPRTVPTQVGTDTSWASIASGWYHSLAVKTDKTLWSWGDNGAGQLGLGDETRRNVPTQVGTDTNWASVTAGSNHTLAVKADGTLWVWGYNYSGQLGLGDSGSGTDRNVPAQVGTGTSWASIAAGNDHSLAVKTDGTLWAWGDNSQSQLGLGDGGGGTNRNVPTQVGTGTSWAYVVAGRFHSLAVKTDGTLWGWGYNPFGQLGVGNNTNQNVPTQVTSF